MGLLIITVVVLFGIVVGENVATSSAEAGESSRELLSDLQEGENMTCGPPPIVEGMVPINTSGSQHAVGTEVNFRCDFGYVSRSPGGFHSTCQFDQQSRTTKWTSPPLTCIPRSCGDPGFVENADRIGDLFTFPHHVEFRCSEGYRLRGQAARFCQANGAWSGRLPTCEKIACDRPTDPTDGRVSFTSLEYGAELSYKCDTGFMLKNHQPRFCTSDGTWSNGDPLCVEAGCEEPTAPKHGQIQILGDSKVDTLVKYSCDENRTLEGASLAKCLVTGQWTFPAPKCLGSCSIPAIVNGRIGLLQRESLSSYRTREVFVEMEMGTTVKHSTVSYLRCDEDFFVVEEGEDSKETKFPRDVSLECTDGKWSKSVRCAPVRCLGDPPTMEHGTAVVNDRTHGFVIWYTCERNYVKGRTGRVQCLYGEWTGSTPVCVDGKRRNRCYSRALNVTGLVKPSVEYIRNTESLLVSCADGFKTSGGYLSCDRGVWEVPKDACVEEDCAGEPPKLEGGTYSFPSRNPGSVVHYECDPPSEMRGSSKVVCRQGKWLGEAPSCFEQNAAQNSSHPTPESPRTAVSTKNMTSAGDGSNRRGTQKGDSSAVRGDCSCSYHHHNRSLVAQVREREFSLRPGDEVKRGESAWLRCRDPRMYQLWPNGLLTNDGPTELACSDCRRWEAKDLPSCVNLQPGGSWMTWRGRFKLLPGGAVAVDANEPVTVSCHSLDVGYPGWSIPVNHDIYYYYDVVGGRRRYNSEIIVLETRPEHTGNYSCSVTGHYRRVYKASKLDLKVNERVLCQRITLDDGDLMIVYNDFERVENSVAEFHCKNSDQQLVGHNKRTCQSDGQWSGENPTCVDVTCPEIKKSEGLKVTYTKGLKPLSLARFHCVPPAVLVGNSCLNHSGCVMCQYNGSWSNPPPSCVVSGCLIGDLMETIPENLVPDMEGVLEELQPVGSDLPLLCEQNLVLVGQKKATCGADGKWSIGDTQCVIGCYFPQEVLSTLLVIDPRKELYRLGEFALFSCPDGRELTSDVERVMCVGSDWSNAIPDCSDVADED